MEWEWISSDLNHFGFSSVKDFRVFLEIGFWFRRYWITQAPCFSPSRGWDLIRDEFKWIISLSPGSDYFRFSSDNLILGFSIGSWI